MKYLSEGGFRNILVQYNIRSQEIDQEYSQETAIAGLWATTTVVRTHLKRKINQVNKLIN